MNATQSSDTVNIFSFMPRKFLASGLCGLCFCLFHSQLLATCVELVFLHVFKCTEGPTLLKDGKGSTVICLAVHVLPFCFVIMEFQRTTTVAVMPTHEPVLNAHAPAHRETGNVHTHMNTPGQCTRTWRVGFSTFQISCAPKPTRSEVLQSMHLFY